MKTINYFIEKSQDVTINVKGDNVVLLSKNEVIDFILDTYGKTFTSRSKAKELTSLSYLGGVNSSAKIFKGTKMNYNTYILYLAPYKTIFGVTCAKAEHCKDACLNTSGRVKMDVREFKILKARYKKTLLFYINRDFFNSWLFAEIDAHSKKYKNFMVRLNGTSDMSPKLFKVNNVCVLDAFKDVQFYDYTKIPNRLDLNYSNYHITFSYDGHNIEESFLAIDKGINVSIVVDGAMPKTYKGIDVFDMDSTDLRPLDKAKGKFGYLKLKQTLNKDYDSKFIIKL
jgi:hypothetical protein